MSITVTQRFASTDTAPFVTVHPPQAERTCVKSDDALTQEAFDPAAIQADQKWAADSGSNKVVGDDVEWSFTLEDTTDATPLDSSKAWVVAFWTTTGEPVSTRTISPQTAGVSEPVYLVEGIISSFSGAVVNSTSTGLVQANGEYNGCDIIIDTPGSGRIRRHIVTHTYATGTHTFTLDSGPDTTVEGEQFWILPTSTGAILEDTSVTIPALSTGGPFLQQHVAEEDRVKISPRHDLTLTHNRIRIRPGETKPVCWDYGDLTLYGMELPVSGSPTKLTVSSVSYGVRGGWAVLLVTCVEGVAAVGEELTVEGVVQRTASGTNKPKMVIDVIDPDQ